MSSIMETGLSCASRPALDDVAGPTRHSTAARKQAANGGGCLAASERLSGNGCGPKRWRSSRNKMWFSKTTSRSETSFPSPFPLLRP